MAIKRIKVSNFKVFKDLDLQLSDYNILIGANASGKSSFVEIFKFLKNLTAEGLKNAISLSGGIEYLRNMNIGSSRPLTFLVTVGGFPEMRRQKSSNGATIYRQVEELTYGFKLDFADNDDKQFSIVEDKLQLKLSFFSADFAGEKKNTYIENRDFEKKGEVVVSLFRDNGVPRLEIEKDKLDFSDDFLSKEMILPSFFQNYEIGYQQTILETPLAFVIEPNLRKILNGISVYNINPSLSRRAVPVEGKVELDEDAGNLPLVLKEIIENKEQKNKLLNLIHDVLPFIKNIDVEKYADRSFLLSLKEHYLKEKYIPAALFSDGTISITALIIVLYFENNSLTIIEEPERNIHPHLISRLVEMFLEVANHRQLIATTHNPELIKYIDLQNLFLVNRDERGFSSINRPVEKKEVAAFLDNDMGIDELYIQNLLEV